MIVWILVIFFRLGYAGGSATVPIGTQAECVFQAQQVRQRGVVEDAFCVPSRAPRP